VLLMNDLTERQNYSARLLYKPGHDLLGSWGQELARQLCRLEGALPTRKR
jgi:hypothetical protein